MKKLEAGDLVVIRTDNGSFCDLILKEILRGEFKVLNLNTGEIFPHVAYDHACIEEVV